MTHATTSFAVRAFTVLATIALIASCGGRNGAPPGGDLGVRTDMTVPRDLGGVDGFVPPTDFGTPDLGPRDLGRPDSGRRMCVPTCATDADCQASCPPGPTPGLPTCCDRMSGMCFNSSVSLCPAPGTGDGGMMMSM
jgi:hypothetical protein